MERKIAALAADILQGPRCGGPVRLEPERGVCERCNAAYAFAGNCLCFEPVAPGSAVPDRERQSALAVGAWRVAAWVHTRHNLTPAVQDAIRRVLGRLDAGGVGLNLGSGWTNVHPRVLNLDVAYNDVLDLTGDAHALPFREGSLSCVISQEVFEHLPRPWDSMREVARTLRPGGLAYIQVPMIIGIHGGEHDYYRFTPNGLRVLIENAGLRVLELSTAVGAGTALYRVAVDFSAGVAARVWSKLYRPVKAAAAVLAAPLRWFDAATMRVSDTNRAAAGYFVIAEKPAQP